MTRIEGRPDGMRIARFNRPMHAWRASYTSGFGGPMKMNERAWEEVLPLDGAQSSGGEEPGWNGELLLGYPPNQATLLETFNES